MLSYFRDGNIERTYMKQQLEDSRARGDLYGVTALAGSLCNVAWLVPDDPKEARRVLRTAWSGWESEGFKAQHFWLLQAEAFLDFYEGEPRVALDRLTSSWRDSSRSQTLMCRAYDTMLSRLHAAACLAVAIEPGLAASERRRLLRAASRTALWMGFFRRNNPMTSPLVASVRAGVSLARGPDERAVELLESAESGFEVCEMSMYAAGARRRRGEIIGGDEGRALFEATDAYKASESVANPKRMTRLLAPGFPDG